MLMELLYCCIEAFVVGTFLLQYFTQKDVLNKPLRVLITYSWILFFSIFVTVTHLNDSWYLVALPSIAVFFIIMHLIFNGSKWEKLLIAIIANGMLALSDLLTLSVLDNIFDIDSQLGNTGGIWQRFMGVLIAKLVYATVMNWIVVLRRKLYAKFTLPEYVMLSVTFLLSTGMVIIAHNIVVKKSAEQFSILFMILCVVLLNVGQLVTMVHIAKTNILKKEHELMQMRDTMLAKSIQEQEESFYQLKESIHNHKHAVIALKSMLETEDYAGIQKYIDSEFTKFEDNSRHLSTGNLTVDTILNNKRSIARKNGIHFTTNISMPEKIVISDLDLANVLGNLLDNAIEALDTQAEKNLHVQISEQKGFLFIKIVNTYSLENRIPASHLKEKKIHGIGIKSVERILQKYQGNLTLTQKNDSFTAVATIPLK